ncbi:uncharacterized protein LOC106153089 isoform X2 [Lingula anatina]|uniref:Uncharacterized protein LOC106153089 isoform X2 n=1 Tax=Lingula anatina TaxID=7574 RepID=A0A1S3H8L0_LINAN|nr:uncharacterized protein LOC106153089 isoform X2 [Lingula anatina]|eukprot:XP_013382348.1 uncharacterized protein LOC106153089 isoform X2 [Lingula anatina]
MLEPESDDLELVYHAEEPAVTDEVVGGAISNGHAHDTATDVSQVNPTLQIESQTSTSTNGTVRFSDPNNTPASSSAVAVCSLEGGEEEVTMTRDMVETRPDGRKVIHTTPELREDLSQDLQDRPLKEKDLKFLKMFSIISIFLFFPLGIPALCYSRKTAKAFHDGILNGDLDKARRFAKRTERFIVLSIVMSLITAIFVFALAEYETVGVPATGTASRTQNLMVRHP